MRATYEEPSLGELISRLGEQAGTLVREEVALAKVELSHKAKVMGLGAGLLVGGAALAFAGLLSLIASCIILLALAVKLWISALIITGLVIAGALLLVMLGLQAIKREDMAPRHTLHTIKEDVEWAKTQAR